ncbi:cation:proton antiporter [Candidatus Peregrinibacteria bacterium]|jgi:Kef-type K+ transport system membrane component KefB|nr:cation:proton antiporter [Candidatus Peregrinibacteria bacterium]
MDQFETLLILMVVIWVAGKIFRAINLPVLFGELLGGIIVGPMVLGIIDPSSEIIKILAELGIFFLMLHAGLETDPHQLIKASKKSFLVAIGGLALPFAGGYFVSTAMGIPPQEALFIGTVLSITAIAITIRLFKEYNLQRTISSNVSIGAAVITDILSLIIFSVVLSVIETGDVSFIAISLLLAKIILFFGLVIFGGMKTAKYMNKFLSKKGFTSALIIALVLGLIAEWIGLHIIIGAFLAGLFIREEILDEKTFAKIEDRIYGLSYSFVGPIFFASLAFYLDFSGIMKNPLLLIALLATAIIGKTVGSGLMARVQKIKPQRALLIGIAMNSKGVVDLIIASIGLEKGIIGTEVFSILVVIAFTSTLFALFAVKPLIKYTKKQ